MSVSEVIRSRLDRAGVRYYASDNISEFLYEDDKHRLINELTEKFEGVLDALIIDRHNDPNSQGTARRLAKMYVNELMAGRYDRMPNATAFPNHVDDGYDGMLVVRSELKSMCSHHHQPVTGVAYIGIIAADKLIGLSKYTRIAQWCARRGTLQEELCNDIAKEIMEATGSENVGVYIQATHGCCENRGISAHSSLTQTTVLNGEFDNPGVKKEFFDNIKVLLSHWQSEAPVHAHIDGGASIRAMGFSRCGRSLVVAADYGELKIFSRPEANVGPAQHGWDDLE